MSGLAYNDAHDYKPPLSTETMPESHFWATGDWSNGGPHSKLSQSISVPQRFGTVVGEKEIVI
jgi:hypothetical protein